MKPLTRCPECRYSLKGLPADHRCPECSFEYDAETAMWKGRLVRKEIVAFVCLNFGGIGMFFTTLSAAPSPSRFIVLALAIFQVAGAAFMLYRWRQVSRGGNVVCATRQGVWIKSGRRIDLFAYSEIDDVFWKTSNRNAGVKIKGRDRPFYIAQIFRRLSDFEDFESEVQSRKQAADGKSLLPPPSDGSWTRRWRSRL